MGTFLRVTGVVCSRMRRTGEVYIVFCGYVYCFAATMGRILYSYVHCGTCMQLGWVFWMMHGIGTARSLELCFKVGGRGLYCFGIQM